MLISRYNDIAQFGLTVTETPGSTNATPSNNNKKEASTSENATHTLTHTHVDKPTDLGR